MNISLDEELNSAFVANAKFYNGEKLADYTEGSRLLLLQVRSDEDTTMFFIWAFIFMHIQIAKNRDTAIELAWNKNLFRSRLLDWMENKNDEERSIASKLVETIVEESNKGEVAIVPSGATASGND
jgi:hypothetical protein